MKQVPHASQVRAIVVGLLKLPKAHRSEMLGFAVDYLHAQCGEQVGTLHDFINAEPDAIITVEVKERLLGVIGRAMRENDAALLQP